MRILMLTAFAVAIAAPAVAASPRFDQCVARAHGTVQEGVCVQAELAAQDARLNKAYVQLMHQLARTPAKQNALRLDERRWIAERDYKCKIDGETIDNDCLVERSSNRADYLERQLRF